MPAPKLTESVILAAIQGFESQKANIDRQIAELRGMLDGAHIGPANVSEAAPGGHMKRSATVRRRMAEAQKARWAKIKGEAELSAPATLETAPKRRKFSAASRRKMAASQRARYARQRGESGPTPEPASPEPPKAK